MLKRYLLFFLLCLPLAASAGTPADSLKKVLARTGLDTVRVRFLNTLAETYVDIDPDSAIIYGTQAKELAEQLTYDLGLAEALRVIGRGYLRAQEYGMASIHLHRALALWVAFGDYHKQMKIHFALAHIAEQQSDFPEALKQYLVSLRFAEQLGDKAQVLTMQMSIGAVYSHMGENLKAIALVEQVLHEHERTGDSLGIAQACNNLGNMLDSEGRSEEARNYLNRAVTLARALGNPMGEAITLGSLANHYQYLEQYDSALVHNQRILILLEQIGDPFRLAAACINTGEILTHLKRYEEAKEYIIKGIGYARSVGAKQWLSNAHAALYDIANAQGDAAEALKEFKLHIAYQDSITNEANTRKAVQVQMQYDFDKKEAETRAEQEKKDIRQRNVRNSLILGLALMIVFAGVFFVQRNRIAREKERSEELLLNILPEEVAEELKAKGHADAKQFDQVTVLFTDFKGFTQIAERMSPTELVAEINECFSAFDRICQKHGVEKIKTIGDAYMAAGGLPVPSATHAHDVVMAGLEMRDFLLKRAAAQASPDRVFQIRIGIHTGPVVAGIVGIKKFQYDIWGDTVNTASRMESSGEPGEVNISEATYHIIKDRFNCIYRGEVEAKGKGRMGMYFVSEKV